MRYGHCLRKLLAASALFALGCAQAPTNTTAQEIRNFKRPAGEGREQWYRDGRRAVEEAKRLRAQTGRAKNVILFVGDGMGVATVTAARILEGQRRGQSGEENFLSFERLPYLALSKTYSANQQTPDSAPTMTAIVTGVKTDDFLVSVDEDAVRGDHTTVKGNELPTFLELAERSGRSTGVVTTATVTHATPAACYAHVPDRGWESDANMNEAARRAGFPDIARQLVEFPHGDGLEVALGGGRAHFFPRAVADPEEDGQTGDRLDGRNLVEEWSRKRPRSAYVWNKQQFDATDARTTERLLGLFERSQMNFEHDRPRDKAGEPSLAEMTSKAVDILSKNPRGFFLMVEGGRIDHAHHDGNAYRALTDTIALSDAVRTALSKTDPRETLIVVTADHSHVLTMAGYPARGNDILGKVVGLDARGQPADRYAKDALGLPYTTLGYANGHGYTGASKHQPEGPKRTPHNASGYQGITKGRPDLTGVDTSDPNYLQETTIPMGYETHGGEDVAIYASGPGAHLFHGVQEQNVIFHVMLEASGLALTDAAARSPARPRRRARR
ncbi:MAG TPA: alkaline phosphatase [Pyrinomonadaceae bacterium]|nr:alkaline phosphatase [Pyrinomonadaceae bacterium]